MELLCVLAAVAALFCGCTVLTLKCRVPASVAPLTALSLIVAVLTLAAMAGVLYPITWAVYALCLAGGVWVLATRKNHAGAVSYTHLDVYKRQLLARGAAVRRAWVHHRPCIAPAAGQTPARRVD